MHVRATTVAGVHLLETETKVDDRGAFSRLFCLREFALAGLNESVSQINHSFNRRKGTLRGLHYQLAPGAETKVVRCLKGALWDVALDLRPDSATFGRWFGAELSEANGLALHIPRGCAHGFITLTDDVEALYLMGAPHAPALERGVRWNEPRFGVSWPGPPVEISSRDAGWPDFEAGWHGIDRLRGLL